MRATNGRQKPKQLSTISMIGGMQVRVLCSSVLIVPNNKITGRPLYAELSPVTDFREACCRQNENGECNRGGFCNFMHLRLASKELVRSLKHGQRLERRVNPPKTEVGGGWEPPKRRSASPPARRGRNDGEDRWTRKQS